jgi:hypothetical protein
MTLSSRVAGGRSLPSVTTQSPKDQLRLPAALLVVEHAVAKGVDDLVSDEQDDSSFVFHEQIVGTSLVRDESERTGSADDESRVTTRFTQCGHDLLQQVFRAVGYIHHVSLRYAYQE